MSTRRRIACDEEAFLSIIAAIRKGQEEVTLTMPSPSVARHTRHMFHTWRNNRRQTEETDGFELGIVVSVRDSNLTFRNGRINKALRDALVGAKVGLVGTSTPAKELQAPQQSKTEEVLRILGYKESTEKGG